MDVGAARARVRERLLAVGRAGSACQVERIVRGWRRVDQIAEARETAHRHKSRALHVYQDEDGMVVIRGRLTPEEGAVLMQALAAARETLYRRARGTAAAHGPVDVSSETSSMAQQQADALALLAETALHQGLDPEAPGERYQGHRPRRCSRPGGCRRARPVRPRGRHTRFLGNVSPAGVRREPRGDAARCGRANRRSGRADAHDSARAVASGSARAITSVTGPTAGRRHSRTSRCCVGVITAPCTRRATR